MTVTLMTQSKFSWSALGYLLEWDPSGKAAMYLASKWAQRNEDERVKDLLITATKKVRPNEPLPTMAQLTWACDFIRVVTKQIWQYEDWYQALEAQNV